MHDDKLELISLQFHMAVQRDELSVRAVASRPLTVARDELRSSGNEGVYKYSGFEFHLDDKSRQINLYS